MTREEAIKWLGHINTREFGWDDYAMQDSQKEIRERCEQGIREAIDMAISALSAEQKEKEKLIHSVFESAERFTSALTEPSDLISRADLIEAIEETDWYGFNTYGKLTHGARNESEAWYKYEDIYKAINKVPSVSADIPLKEWKYLVNEAEKLKKSVSAERVGVWQQDYRKTANGVDFCVISCSECDYYDAQMHYYNYCPNCGARMENKK